MVEVLRVEAWVHGRSEYLRMYRTCRIVPSMHYVGLPMETATAQALTEVRALSPLKPQSIN